MKYLVDLFVLILYYTGQKFETGANAVVKRRQ